MMQLTAPHLCGDLVGEDIDEAPEPSGEVTAPAESGGGEVEDT